MPKLAHCALHPPSCTHPPPSPAFTTVDGADGQDVEDGLDGQSVSVKMLKIIRLKLRPLNTEIFTHRSTGPSDSG